MRKETLIDGVNYLVLDWKEVEKLTYDVGDKIEKINFKPTMIIGILRDGPVVRILSDYLKVKRTRMIGVKTYEGIGKAGNTEIYQLLTEKDLSKEDVLLADDVVDKGYTFSKVLELEIKPRHPRRLLTASLHVKPERNDYSKITPDVYAEETKRNTWIVYPWEKFETGEEIVDQLTKRGYDKSSIKNTLKKTFMLKEKEIARVMNRQK